MANAQTAAIGNHARTIRFLLFVAGLGGLLYGIDVGIIAGALPYLEATTKLSANELSVIVAAVLLGSVFSTVFAGVLADLMGRKKLMALAGLLFVASIPAIALSSSYAWLVGGRMLQGLSAGLVGVVVPLYLAECLPAESRGKGTGIFQWLLTLGFVATSGIALAFSMYIANIETLHDAAKLLAAKDIAWRGIFWSTLPPGVLFMLGALVVPESPRWLFGRNRRDAALNSLLRTRTPEQAAAEFQEIADAAAAEMAKTADAGAAVKESLLRRKYVIPFLLACIILACNQLTGVNSIIGYNATILIQAGLNDGQAHAGWFIFTTVNVLLTALSVLLVDRAGRKKLLSIGSAGVVVSLACIAALFYASENKRVDCSAAVQKMVAKDQSLSVGFDEKLAQKLLAGEGEPGRAIAGRPTSLIIIYAYGDFRSATKVVRSDELAKPIEIERKDCVPGNRAAAALTSSPFGDLAAASVAPLKIEHALITPVPSPLTGWLAAVCLFSYIGFFAVGPGVCVWLALSELMPTRIRSNGMSVALLINQAVAMTIAAIFLPTVGQYGYSAMFLAFAGFTVIYFITATFFLPETKGKTLEEIEAYFSGKRR